MARKIEIVVPGDRSDTVLDRLRNLEGVVGASMQRQGSTEPPGDMISVVVTNDTARAVFTVLDEMDVPTDGAIRVTRLDALVSSSRQGLVDRESSEPPWESLSNIFRRETNPTANYFALMALSGTLAAAGLWADTPIFVIGAMILAPGFEPLLRFPYGFIGGLRSHARSGLIATVGGYAVLALTAGVTYGILTLIDPSRSTNLEARYWVAFWSTVTPPGVVVALAAGAAGIVTVTADRPVLTAGVMVALALIPSMSLVGMGLAQGELDLAGRALLRWAVDAVAVAGVGAVILVIKRRQLHKRGAMS